MMSIYQASALEIEHRFTQIRSSVTSTNYKRLGAPKPVRSNTHIGLHLFIYFIFTLLFYIAHVTLLYALYRN